LAWSYDWSGVLPAAERRTLFAAYEALDLPIHARMSVEDVAPFCYDSATGPDGLYLALLSGHLIALEHSGQVRWVHRGSCPMITSLGLSRACVALEIYQSPQARQPIAERLLPFCLTEPPWSRVQAATGAERTDLTYWNLVALDAVTGAVLDQFEPQQLITCGPTPAYNMLVFGQQSMTDEEQNRIIAYPWLQWEVH
jgi:hypothetical protein